MRKAVFDDMFLALLGIYFPPYPQQCCVFVSIIAKKLRKSSILLKKTLDSNKFAVYNMNTSNDVAVSNDREKGVRYGKAQGV